MIFSSYLWKVWIHILRYFVYNCCYKYIVFFYFFKLNYYSCHLFAVFIWVCLPLFLLFFFLLFVARVLKIMFVNHIPIIIKLLQFFADHSGEYECCIICCAESKSNMWQLMNCFFSAIVKVKFNWVISYFYIVAFNLNTVRYYTTYGTSFYDRCI